MDEFIQDLRYTLRVLRKSPAFTLVAVLTIALGIGVNSTIFSLVNAVLLRPLPVERPEELVDVYGHVATSTDHGTTSYLDYLDYKEQSETLSGMIAYSNFFASLSVSGSSELVIGELVSEDYFSVLGVRALMGRTFSPDEFVAEGASPVAVLSHPFWQTRFAADPDVVGDAVRINGTVYTVVGVAPESFRGMFPGVTAQMWLPVTMVAEVEPLGNQRGGSGSDATRLQSRNRRFLWLRGRLNPGVEVGQARAELEGISARLSAEYPETNELERVSVVPTNDVAINPDLDRALAPVGLVLLGAVGLVLLVACANLANMMLARASVRRREIAVRLAMGAKRGRLVRQMMTESMTLALAGGIAAMLLSVWLTRLVARFQPPLPIDIGLNIDPDWRVLAFTLAVAGATGVIFGLVPALRASRPDLVPALKDSGDGRATSVRGFELRDTLVVLQVAVSLVLLVGGALVVRSLGVAGQMDFAYDLDRTAYLSIATEMNGYSDEQAGVLIQEAKLRLEALPGVQAVGMTSRVPLSLNNNGFGLFIDGHQDSNSDRPYILDGARVDEGYFDALGLQIVAGRAIEPADADERRRVAVVTAAMASRFWPDENVLGREFRTTWGGEPYRIVGVVENYKVDTPGEDPKPYIHLPFPRETASANFLVRTATPAAPQVPAFEREFRALDPDLVFLDTGTARGLAQVRLFPIQAGAWLIGAFGVLALVLAAVGLYGVIAYSVNRRLREIGIRMALGADGSTVARLVLRKGMTLVAIGAVIGVVLAAMGARALSAVLFVGPFDVPSFAIATAVLAAVAAVANWVPARRASRVDPMVVLRGS